VNFTAANHLANDSHANGDALVVTTVGSTATAGGMVVDNGGGSWACSPPAAYTGSDTFAYTISDGRGGVARPS
jgi:hypothetical protein